jgi:hypothetical protein
MQKSLTKFTMVLAAVLALSMVASAQTDEGTLFLVFVGFITVWGLVAIGGFAAGPRWIDD